MYRKQGGFTILELFVVLVVIAAFSGYIANIYKIAVTPSFSDIAPILILRFIGVVIAPLGSILGFV